MNYYNRPNIFYFVKYNNNKQYDNSNICIIIFLLVLFIINILKSLIYIHNIFEQNVPYEQAQQT